MSRPSLFLIFATLFLAVKGWAPPATSRPSINTHPHHHASQTDLTAPIFSLNVSSITRNSPFTASCTLSGSQAPTGAYQIHFYNSAYGRLATYERPNGILTLNHLSGSFLEIHQAPKQTYPQFDLSLRDKKENDESFWCSVSVAGGAEVKSNVWTPKGTLELTLEAPSATQRKATCTVGHFKPPASRYLVQFSAKVNLPRGVQSYIMLGQYDLKGNQTPEFTAYNFPEYPYTVTHGSEVSFPTFSILVDTSATFNGTWWCELRDPSAQAYPMILKSEGRGV